MSIKSIVILLTVIVLQLPAVAQQTGSFNHQLTFMGQSRTLSCYVPTSYDPTVKYRLMVGLHGMGDNSTNYRSALINSLNWQNIFPNTIFVFPDGGNDQFRDFYEPAGDEAIIDSAIAFAMQNYSIDSSFVVLQGFSLGGRSAAKFGLEHHTKFKGLLLNTPAFQGYRDIANDSLASLVYDYSNASEIPIYFTVGERDQLYYFLSQPLITKLKKHDAIIRYEPVANLQHTIPASSITSPAYPFFEDPASADFDVDIFDIGMPQHSCDANLSPVVYVQNRGNASVTSLEIHYDFAGGSGSYIWTGNIGAYDHAQVTLPSMATAQGKQALELSIGVINGNQTDTVLENNQLTDTVEVDIIPDTLSLSEGFEGNSEGWVFNETGTLFGWFRDTDVKKSGTASIAAFNTILLFYTRGNVESFESPVVDLSTKPWGKLTFDVAYNYHRYTPPILSVDTSFTDTLEVVISTDCGQSWQSLYKKAGPDLATAANPILNPLSLAQVFFQPTASQWRTDTIDLASFGNETEAIIRFNYISDNGGSIYIDNILIDGAGIGIGELSQSSFEVYPNPASDRVRIFTADRELSGVQIFNIAGSRVLSAEGSQTGNELNLEISHLPAGVYHVEVSSGQSSGIRKLLIAK